mgnify:CR=1 FL=1
MNSISDRVDYKNVCIDSVKDELKAYTKVIPFKKLGFNYEGNTEALVFDTQIKLRVQMVYTTLVF